MPVVRDAEIEALVRDYARPIFRAAGLPEDGVDIVLVNDQSFNAFVAGSRMFINTGALMSAETPNEIIGMGVAAGGGEMAQRSILAYQRTEEMTADRSAITYLNATGQSGLGMLKTFGRFQSALSLSGAQVDPYRISHPLPRERIANLEVLVKQSPYVEKIDPPALQQRHDMM
ncbi:MAG: M48 family peptidase, partial [Mesorhizobium sp.]